MTQCKSIGCPNTAVPGEDLCFPCLPSIHKVSSTAPPKKDPSSGGDNDYWLLDINDPKRLDPYKVECEDVIEALEMSFQEGEAFKAIWRKCAARLGNGKPGDSQVRNSEKVRHFGDRMVVMDRRKLQCAS